MSFEFEYKTNKAGEFILDENGDKIIIGVNRIGDVEKSRRIVQRKPRLGALMSFDVYYRDTDNKWHLTVNKKEYVGRYNTQAEALSVLFSMATSCSGRDFFIDAAFDEQLSRGVSYIQPTPFQPEP